MIYFFHHYELPVILQQAQIQDLLMRNQEGGPPLRVAHGPRLGAGIGATAAAAALNNNNNNNAVNNNNAGGNVVNRRMAGFNIGGFRFRFGVVLTTHQHNIGNPNPPAPPPPQQQQPDNRPPQSTRNHGHGHSHGQHGHSHGHQHGHSHGSHSHGHSHLDHSLRHQPDSASGRTTERQQPAHETNNQTNDRITIDNADENVHTNTEFVNAGEACLSTDKNEANNTVQNCNVALDDGNAVADEGDILSQNCHLSSTTERSGMSHSENCDVSSDSLVNNGECGVNCDKGRQQNHVMSDVYDNNPNEHCSASQSVGEKQHDSSTNSAIISSSDVLNDAELEEVTNDLRQVSTTLKSVLHTNEGSDT